MPFTSEYHRNPPVQRTRSRKDARISPFLLDPSQVHHQYSRDSSNCHPTRTEATWLHLPVFSRQVSTREEALHAMSTMSRLRHPNLEQLLGVVADNSAPVMCVITERVQGPSLKSVLGWSSRRRTKFLRTYLLPIALDVSRVLIYFHSKTGEAHYRVCADAVMFDEGRCRAVLLLSGDVAASGPCAAPETVPRGAVTEASDTYGLSALIMQMSEAAEVQTEREDDVLPRPLRRILNSCLREDPRRRPDLRDLCQELIDCCDSSSRPNS